MHTLSSPTMVPSDIQPGHLLSHTALIQYLLVPVPLNLKLFRRPTISVLGVGDVTSRHDYRGSNGVQSFRAKVTKSTRHIILAIVRQMNIRYLKRILYCNVALVTVFPHLQEPDDVVVLSPWEWWFIAFLSVPLFHSLLRGQALVEGLQ